MEPEVTHSPLRNAPPSLDGLRAFSQSNQLDQGLSVTSVAVSGRFHDRGSRASFRSNLLGFGLSQSAHQACTLAVHFALLRPVPASPSALVVRLSPSVPVALNLHHP